MGVHATSPDRTATGWAPAVTVEVAATARERTSPPFFALLLVLLAACAQRVEGVVRASNGTPVAGAWVQAGMYDSATSTLGAVGACRSDADGSFSISGFGAGVLVVDAALVAPAEEESVRTTVAGGGCLVDRPSGRIVLSVEDSSNTIHYHDIVLGVTERDGARVRGRLTGVLRPDVFTYLVMANYERPSGEVLVHVALCDPSGAFEFGYLPPGSPIVHVDTLGGGFGFPNTSPELVTGSDEEIRFELPYHDLAVVSVVAPTGDERLELVSTSHRGSSRSSTGAGSMATVAVEGEYEATVKNSRGSDRVTFEVKPGAGPISVELDP